MARIVNLNVLAPEDIDFVMPDGATFRVSGDVPMETMLRLARLEQRMVECGAEIRILQAATPVDDEALEAASTAMVDGLEDLCDLILGLLRVHQPELEEVPFGQHQVSIFLAALRQSLDDEAGVDPTKPPSTKTGNRSQRRTSTRSTGSRPSSKSSASRRTTGGE